MLLYQYSNGMAITIRNIFQVLVIIHLDPELCSLSTEYKSKRETRSLLSRSQMARHVLVICGRQYIPNIIRYQIVQCGLLEKYIFSRRKNHCGMRSLERTSWRWRGSHLWAFRFIAEFGIRLMLGGTPVQFSSCRWTQWN